MKLTVNGHVYYPEAILMVSRIEKSDYYYWYEFIMKIGDINITEKSFTSDKVDLEELTRERDWFIDYTIPENGNLDFESKYFK